MYQCDLSDIPSINSLVETVKQKEKAVSVLINVAGIWHGSDEVYANREFETFPQK